MLTDPLEGGEGSCCRVCGRHADDDPLRGLAARGRRRVRRRGHSERQAQECQPKLPQCLEQFQILTHAAGTDTKIIVWVTTGLRPEHRAARDWLNEHTDPESRFFGAEIEVVRIGDSTLAPNFNLVAQPNDWGKQVKAATGAAPLTERSKLYREFWEKFLDRIATEHPARTKAKASTHLSWYDLPSGTTGVSYETSFSKHGLRVLIVFNSPDASLNLDPPTCDSLICSLDALHIVSGNANGTVRDAIRAGGKTDTSCQSVTHDPDELQTLRGQLRRQPVINGVLADLVSLHGSVRVPRVVHQGTVIELGL